MVTPWTRRAGPRNQTTEDEGALVQLPWAATRPLRAAAGRWALPAVGCRGLAHPGMVRPALLCPRWAGRPWGPWGWRVAAVGTWRGSLGVGQAFSGQTLSPQDREGRGQVVSGHNTLVLTLLGGPAGRELWGALAPPASRTVTKAEPPRCPPRFHQALSPGRPFSAGPWKRPRQRPPLSGPRPAVLRLDKAGPFTAARADRAIQCLDNSTTKSLWPFRLHQLGAALPPLRPFRTLGRENSHRPQRQA